jgi:hypothetical protein
MTKSDERKMIRKHLQLIEKHQVCPGYALYLGAGSLKECILGTIKFTYNKQDKERKKLFKRMYTKIRDTEERELQLKAMRILGGQKAWESWIDREWFKPTKQQKRECAEHRERMKRKVGWK